MDEIKKDEIIEMKDEFSTQIRSKQKRLKK